MEEADKSDLMPAASNVCVSCESNSIVDQNSCEKSDTQGEIDKRDEVRSKKENMKIQIALTFLKRIFLLLLGYIICYFNFSLTLPIVAISSMVWYENTKSVKGERIQKKIRASKMTKTEILEIVKDLPAWVNFPDREKAEWLNEIISQLWPSLNCYIIKYWRGKIQTNIRKKFESFKFEDLDFGKQPPKIDGVKVYHNSVSKDSIIIDFEVFYDGDCDINFSMSGAQIGTIKDFQMGVEIRVVLKPILLKMPIVGGIQFFFLNIPDIHFELEGITGIPGFSYLVRQKIEEIINKKLVFPNKITKRFTKSVEAAELKSIEAEGVLRVHVFEAKDLEKKDVTGKSDPYVILNVGAQEYRTQVIKRDLNPQWDYYCEFIILDPVAQQLYFKLFDQDEFNEDDFLGSGAVEIFEVIKPGKTDQWFTLENVKHGKIHMRFSWLVLSCERRAIDAAAEETRLLKIENIHTALLTIYVDSATNLPKVKSYKKPDPYLILTVGKNQTKSRIKKHTCNPAWEQGFYLLVTNPENDNLIVNIIDKQTDAKMDRMVYNIADLLSKPQMQISKEKVALQLNPESKITISLQLRILHNDQYEQDDSESDDDLTPNRCSTDNDMGPLNENSPLQEKIVKRLTSDVTSSPKLHAAKFTSRSKALGMIQLSISYSELRQKLSVTVHKAANLLLPNPDHIPDPYVTLRIDNTDIKDRTKVVVDTCDPVFEEKFEYLLSFSELPSHHLIVTIKNKKFFGSSVLGEVTVNLSEHISKSSQFEWYELSEPQEPKD